MPEISRFYGIIIRMFFKDHKPAHFHAKYSKYQCKIRINDGMLIEGSMPGKQIKLVQAWTVLHKEELKYNYKESQKNSPKIKKIKPLS